jgi:hypothetical protein
MRDYTFDPDGKDPGVPIAELPTATIQELLDQGFEPNGEAPVEAIRERLRLELHIRALGLR